MSNGVSPDLGIIAQGKKKYTHTVEPFFKEEQLSADLSSRGLFVN